MSTHELEMRPPTAAEFPTMWRSLVETFGETPRDSDQDLDATVFEPERSLITLDGEDIVSTAGIFSRELTVPGAIVPLAAVTLVSVAPTHRRRGLLTRMIIRQLTELHEQGSEAVAGLWASEAAIYQRFGYGSAARRAILSGATRDTAFRAGTDIGSGRIRQLPQDKVRPHAAAVYERLRPAAVGHLDRPDKWWDYRLHDPEHWRDGATELRFVVHEDVDGAVTGWAAYRIKNESEHNQPNSLLTVQDLSATTTSAYAALWRFLLDLDLIRRFRRRMSSLDEPLQHLVLDPRALQTEITDALWVRLVDVGRALAARRYRTEIDAVLEVTDAICPWNARRWRLSAGPGGADCAPTTEPADVRVSSTELGAAYLGGTSLVALARAGRVEELRGGRLIPLSTALGWAPAPWCPEVF